MTMYPILYPTVHHSPGTPGSGRYSCGRLAGCLLLPLLLSASPLLARSAQPASPVPADLAGPAALPQSAGDGLVESGPGTRDAAGPPPVPATDWQPADPAERTETLAKGVRIREGYRYQDPLRTGTEHTPADLALARRAARLQSAQPSTGEARYTYPAWISGLRVDLIGDRDHDGYYRGFRLDIDVDTTAASADVYAVIYLQGRGQPLQALHNTLDFRIGGTSRGDEYSLEIELLDDYRAGRYDLAIDIIDSVHGRLLDAVSASEFTSLGGLPLEAPDGSYDDACFADIYDYSDPHHDDYPDDDCHYADDYPYSDDLYDGDTVGVAYAGGTGGALLLTAALAGCLRRRCRIRAQAVLLPRP